MQPKMILRTYSGKPVDLRNPQVEDVDIESIAHALSNIGRFTGHTRYFYSVANHSLLVRELLRAHGCSVDMQLAALLHDAHEAFVGDVATPLKEAIRDGAAVSSYDRLAAKWDAAIQHSLGVAYTFETAHIRWADHVALWLEADLLLPGGTEYFKRPPGDIPPLPSGWEPMRSNALVEHLFLNAYKGLKAWRN